MTTRPATPLKSWLVAAGLGLSSLAPVAAISSPALVADLGTRLRPDRGSRPHGFASLPGGVVFAAQPDDHADRLFVTDGSGEGTHELAAPCEARVPGEVSLIYEGRLRAYYLASCEDGSSALWATDGSSLATRSLLALTHAGPDEILDLSVGLYGVGSWADLGNTTYFLLGRGWGSPRELWRTDGTGEGTAPIRVLEEALGDSSVGLVATSGGRLAIVAYHSVDSASHEVLFWGSDGTAANTTLARRVPATGSGFSFPYFAGSEAGVLLWMRGENDTISELWFSDGTDAGTRILGLLRSDQSWVDSFGGLKVDGRSIFFVATSDGRRSIWRSDLTAESTRPIVEVTGWHANTRDLVVLADRLIVPRCDESEGAGCELWRTPKTEGVGAPLLGGCGAGPCDSIPSFNPTSAIAGGVLFRTSSLQQTSLWFTDGSDAPATELARPCAGEDCTTHCVHRLESADDFIFLTSPGCEPPFDLWVSDGSPLGSFRLGRSLEALEFWRSGPFVVPVDASTWVFGASRGGVGLELWRAERRPDSAVLLADLRRDRPGLSAARALGEVDGAQLFSILGDDGRTIVVRRSADGLLVDELFSIPPVYPESPELRQLRFHGIGEDWLFFAGYSDSSPMGNGAAYQLYRFRPATGELTSLFADPGEEGVGASLSSDLLPSNDGYLFLGATTLKPVPSIYRWRPGASEVEAILSLPASAAVSAGSNLGKWFVVEESRRLVAIDLDSLTRKVLFESPDTCEIESIPLEFGTAVLILTSTAEVGPVLQFWLTDGKGSGTGLVTQIPWSERFWCSSGFAVSPGFAQGAALIELDENCGGTQHVWTSDGSRERTRPLFSSREWYPDVGTSARFRGVHYFFVVELDPSGVRYRTALWQSDGTPEGSRRATWLPDRPWDGAHFALDLAAGASALYFPWADVEGGAELWQSDGTAEGTGPVADLEPGAGSSSPSELIAVGDQVLFSATTAGAGRELWQVDGASHQPEIVSDLYPGPESSAPLWVTGSREPAFFLADDGVVGRELWEIDRPSVAPCVADATTLCLANGRFRARAVRRDFAGELSAAGVVPLTGDSGYFWFFAPGNPEVLLKVVDACGLPGFENFWAYSTGLTNVEVELEVVDTLSGERKIVRTALGDAYGPLFDSGSFQVCAEGSASAGSVPAAAPVEGVGSSTVLPLLDGRFEARASWRKRDGTAGVAAAVPLAGDSGFFWFFDPAIVEVLVKMVDACGEGGFDNFWVFAGGLTDVEVHLEVTDTWSGEVVRHDNLQGRPFSTLLETGKLSVCEVSP